MKRSKSNTRGFTRSAYKTHGLNNYSPMRGGIRL